LCQPRNGKNLINPNFPSWKGTHHSRYHLASLKEELTVNEHSRRHITSINCNQNICMHAQVNLTISVSSMNPSELAWLALLLCLNKRGQAAPDLPFIHLPMMCHTHNYTNPPLCPGALLTCHLRAQTQGTDHSVLPWNSSIESTAQGNTQKRSKSGGDEVAAVADCLRGFDFGCCLLLKIMLAAANCVVWWAIVTGAHRLG
jgi:hypothetical protein